MERLLFQETKNGNDEECGIGASTCAQRFMFALEPRRVLINCAFVHGCNVAWMAGKLQ